MESTPERPLSKEIHQILNSFKNSMAFSAPELLQMHIDNLEDNINLILDGYDAGQYDVEYGTLIHSRPMPEEEG
jgi:phage terminase Nu1 subunit (DNA packaging protein)